MVETQDTYNKSLGDSAILERSPNSVENADSELASIVVRCVAEFGRTRRVGENSSKLRHHRTTAEVNLLNISPER